MIVVDGKIVGSELIGQNFSSPGYFQGRPSVVGYAANNSGASNYGPTSANLIEEVSRRIEYVRHINNLYQNASVPGELVLASASGLDPHISLANAALQAERVARARGLSKELVFRLMRQYLEGPSLGFLGEPGVNVVRLNLALDEQSGESSRTGTPKEALP